MEEYQQRVVKEKDELDAKIKALQAFTCAAAFSDLDEIDQKLLLRQSGLMQLYSSVLAQRIARFGWTR
jgi:hypothetical protein